MRFGKLEIDPARNPAILDTATWDRAAAWQQLKAAVEQWSLAPGKGDQAALPPQPGLAIEYQARHGESTWALVGLPDGQKVLMHRGPLAASAALGPPLAQAGAPQGAAVAVYPTDATVLDRFFRYVDAARAPRALGPSVRLGVGTRMTTMVWPGIWEAMRRGGFAANAIQNSVRELNLLPQLLDAQPAERNIAFNFGAIETGYAGSTFEGLWVAGVLAALAADPFPAAGYGADADHIQVKRGAAGLARALRLVDAGRYYTFFTLDVSDVLDYGALLNPSQAAVDAAFAEKVPDTRLRQALLADYSGARRIGGVSCALDAGQAARLAVKYWDALQAVEALAAHITGLKAGARFDLELSIDEHPGEVPTFDCLTGAAELAFVLSEARRRGIPLTHIAPNYGVEKGVDYACPDGLPGLEARAAQLGRITEEFGVMADFHSGDDLSQATRQAIRRATGGRLHFKVSPMIQLLFGEVLAEYHPELFRRWWLDARAYAEREALNGSEFAAACLRETAARGAFPAPHDALFHHFSFAFVGRRDAEGRFLVREEFYSLSPEFRAAYAERITHYLLGLAHDLF